MRSAFSNVIAAAFGTLRSVAGVAVTYQRGATSLAVTAVPGRSTVDVVDATERSTLRVDSSDWLIAAEDLGALGEPRKGDVVKLVSDDRTSRTVYTVMHPPFSPSDGADGRRFRVHSLKNRTEPNT